jgi:predicted DNA-binding transcriptional regulator YafY
MTMPSSDPSKVTLYKLTSETVLTGRGYPPESIQVQMRSIEEKEIWFSHDLVFAIEPALKSILEMPFKNQLREALQSELEEHKKTLAAQRRLTALSNKLADAVADINSFQDAPLLRRLWIALRPIKNWPEA